MGRRQRPIDINEEEDFVKKAPRINLPSYADDDEEPEIVDRYANIPTGEADVMPAKPVKPRPAKNNFPPRPNQKKPQNFGSAQSQRKQVVYDADPF